MTPFQWPIGRTLDVSAQPGDSYNWLHFFRLRISSFSARVQFLSSTLKVFKGEVTTAAAAIIDFKMSESSNQVSMDQVHN